jgi:hypothetical protein
VSDVENMLIHTELSTLMHPTGNVDYETYQHPLASDNYYSRFRSFEVHRLNNKTLVGWASCPPMVYLITPGSAVFVTKNNNLTKFLGFKI